jgi:hypothetical protein
MLLSEMVRHVKSEGPLYKDTTLYTSPTLHDWTTRKTTTLNIATPTLVYAKFKGYSSGRQRHGQLEASARHQPGPRLSDASVQPGRRAGAADVSRLRKPQLRAPNRRLQQSKQQRSREHIRVLILQPRLSRPFGPRSRQLCKRGVRADRNRPVPRPWAPSTAEGRRRG